ncbi:MAG: TrbI/VirB10 family protein [Bdellovibrionales bacterium]
MEVAKKNSIYAWLSKAVLKEPKPFTNKRDLNWKAMRNFGSLVVVTAVVLLLLMPTPKPDETVFHERAEPGSTDKVAASNPTEDAWAQLQQGQLNRSVAPSSLNHLYQGSSGGNKSQDKNSSMILTRGGMNSKTQVPPGTRMRLRLTQQVTVASQAMPVIGVVTKEVDHDDSMAIPEGAKLYGEASFDGSIERAQIAWRSIVYPDGRQRQISALGISDDGQVGVKGKVHSEALKNTLGQTLTKFIGAYAVGSMSTGMLGASEGGHENGLKNAVAETAKDRATVWAEDMSKEKKWIELSAGAETQAVINQPFTFRDPGGTYGQ